MNNLRLSLRSRDMATLADTPSSLMKEAQEDKKRREEIEVRNNAAAAAYQVERQIKLRPWRGHSCRRLALYLTDAKRRDKSRRGRHKCPRHEPWFSASPFLPMFILELGRNVVCLSYRLRESNRGSPRRRLRLSSKPVLRASFSSISLTTCIRRKPRILAPPVHAHAPTLG